MEMDRGKSLTLLTGIGLGAALMYFLDASDGGRRRALARDKSLKTSRRIGRTVHDRVEDTGNRLRGAALETRARISEDAPGNEQLESRIRAELGHHVDHARSIEVIADDGRVILRGQALRDELDDVLDTVESVNGVKSVESELEVRDQL
jgi:osmotically-inducible protein OsmY